MTIRILIGDARERLGDLPDESVHCCVTSPPYFGLRDYGIEPVVWGGEADCEHEWGEHSIAKANDSNRGTMEWRTGGNPAAKVMGRPPSQGQFCRSCQAWRGSLGLEPTPDLYVEHMVAVFRAVRRVLRNDGTVFLNLGDSYYGAGYSNNKNTRSATRSQGGKPRHARAHAPNATAYGTSGKAPVDSPARDCLCGSLCGACRKAYQTGKSHNGFRPAPTPMPSPSETSRAHMGLPSGHPPTSDSLSLESHSETASPVFSRSPDHEGAPLHAFQETTPAEFSRQHLEDFHQSGTPLACLLCEQTLTPDEQASVDKSVCTCGMSLPELAGHNLNRGVSDSACPHSTRTSLKPKDLIGIPWLVAFALRADGWYLRSDIIWAKPNPMPESVTDRPTSAHEHVFLLSKSARYWYDADAVRLPPAGRTDPTTFGSPPERNDGDRVYLQDGQKGANLRNVWTIATQPYPEAHFATFPPKLAETCIKAGCPKGGTVLDPFGGSGTTGLVADRLQRDAILIELKPEYAAMAEARIYGDAPIFSSVTATAP